VAWLIRAFSGSLWLANCYFTHDPQNSPHLTTSSPAPSSNESALSTKKKMGNRREGPT